VFFIGIIGLNISSYGFEGTKASMRMGRRWAARDVTLVMMHGEHSWVDLEDGRTRRETSFDFLLGEKRHRINSRSCFDPQFVDIIAYRYPVLSWTLETVLSSRNRILKSMGSNTTTSMFETPEMSGFGLESLDNIILVQMFQKQGSSTHLPVLTDQIPASLFSGRKSLPTDDAVSQIFLAPQAEAPITGNTW
jgi:hypothetical protein